MVIMGDSKRQSVYYVVIFVTKYRNFEEAQSRDPETIADHIARSKKLHEEGGLLMGGALLDKQEPLSTMVVFTSREAAEQYVKEDPFVLKGMVATRNIREWVNMFA